MDVLEFAKTIGKSKRIKRAGWVREGVKNPESVADHGFRVIVLSMVLAPMLNVNQNKLIKMAIIHDIGETKTNDLVCERGVNKDPESYAKKEELEKDALKEIFEDFEKRPEYISIFEEMINQKTDEAKIFKQIDKLEMAIQALEYEESDEKNLSEFFDNADLYITHPILKEIMEKAKLARKKK